MKDRFICYRIYQNKLSKVFLKDVLKSHSRTGESKHRLLWGLQIFLPLKTTPWRYYKLCHVTTQAITVMLANYLNMDCDKSFPKGPKDQKETPMLGINLYLFH